MDSNHITQLISDLLGHMGVAHESIEVSTLDGRTRFSVRTPDSHLLIGAKGANLLALNHVVKKIVTAKRAAAAKNAVTEGETFAGEGGPEQIVRSKTCAGEPTFFVDVNGYQEAALGTLKTLAKVMGERARSLKASVELEPMSSYERMIIHSFFQDAPDLQTASTGDGERRRVVIKYTGDQSL